MQEKRDNDDIEGAAMLQCHWQDSVSYPGSENRKDSTQKDISGGDGGTASRSLEPSSPELTRLVPGVSSAHSSSTSPVRQMQGCKNNITPMSTRRRMLRFGMSRERKTLVRMLQDHIAKDVPYEAIIRLSNLFAFEELSLGTVLWKENGSATKACMLMKGSLAGMRGSSDETEKMRKVQTILPGNLAGELGLLCGKNHSGTVVAEEKSLVAVLLQAQVSHLSTTDPQVLSILQGIALSTAYSRSTQLSMFNAGSLPRGGSKTQLQTPTV
ncbi:unnamed protein product [Choristocarpus tenellus]